MKGVLIDTNLLCLFVVGSLGVKAVAGHSRLNAYNYEDYENVVAIIDRAGDPVLCPHVLTETSNLLTYKQSASQITDLRNSLAYIVAECRETSIAATQAVADPEYPRLGLTDAMLLLMAANEQLLLLSVDLGLCLEAERRGLRVLNYNYVRDGAVDIADIA